MGYRISYFPITSSFPSVESGSIPQAVEDFDSLDASLSRFKELDERNATVYLQITNNA